MHRPYRCNDCGWRGIGKHSSSWMKHPAKYSKNQLILIVILAAIFIILILWLVSREPDKEEIPLQEGRLYQTSTLA
ncbi:MAG: hypothetical protein CVU71_01140 [Deltaproteobacteria bacterium HGW-Deltaproteobacteria-6]|nr:MAG: hypothetical protein CVU71_01140 [Deltaproteobacteria bacterium HGW-Deltaproteobacteria-6]